MAGRVELNKSEVLGPQAKHDGGGAGKEPSARPALSPRYGLSDFFFPFSANSRVCGVEQEMQRPAQRCDGRWLLCSGGGDDAMDDRIRDLYGHDRGPYLWLRSRTQCGRPECLEKPDLAWGNSLGKGRSFPS